MMEQEKSGKPGPKAAAHGGAGGWLEQRLPLAGFVRKNFADVRVPRNLNFMWSFGSLAGLALVLQIVTGLLLAVHYRADAGLAFASVQHIMRQVEWGWLVRGMHAVGAGFFFMVVYAHMARGLYYGSYKAPREVLWGLGVVLFGLMMASAFTGYVLPWGQMSYWGATVVANMVSAVPWVGKGLGAWLWGGEVIGDATLVRFYALHFALPFLVVVVVVAHVWALRTVGSGNPLGVQLKAASEHVPFHPYYTANDVLGAAVYLFLFAAVVFFAPDVMGNPENTIPANPAITPAHIVPEWYFMPFFAMLRAVPVRELAAPVLFASVAVLVALPWLDRSPVRSARFRPLYRPLCLVFMVNFGVLGWCGANPPEGLFITVAQVATVVYFGFFALLPLVARFEKPLPLPPSPDRPLPPPLSKKGTGHEE